MDNRYLDIRSQIRTGDIFIEKGKFPLAWAIQKWAGEGSHAGIFHWIGDRLFVTESNTKGVHPILASERLWKSNYCILQDMSPRPGQEQNIYDSWGKGYDYSSLFFRQPLFILSGGRWLQNKQNRSNKFYCSELIAYIKDIDDWWTITPNKLLNHDDFQIILPFK